MSAEQVALIAHCPECDALWLPADEERWSAYLTYDEPAELVFYCPTCAEREFNYATSRTRQGSPRRRSRACRQSLARELPCRS